MGRIVRRRSEGILALLVTVLALSARSDVRLHGRVRPGGVRHVKVSAALLLGDPDEYGASVHPADLKDLLTAHLEAFGVAERLETHGPAISLSAMAAQYFGMAFHELCTNAVKHGALSVQQGRISVRWTVGDPEAAHDFNLVVVKLTRFVGQVLVDHQA